MSRLFPSRSDVDSSPNGEPRIVKVDEDAAEDVFSALSPQTTRTILTTLYDSPKTAGELADTTDTTIQNVHYHLDKLLAAELIDVVDTWYSEKGREMNVYAPVDSSVVLFASDETDVSTIRLLFKRLVGSIGLITVAGAITRACTGIFNALRRAGQHGMEDGGTGTPSTPPDAGVTLLSPEFLALWILIAVGLGLMWRRWT